MQCSSPSYVIPKGSVVPIAVPCGCCIACRINKTTEWATRCLYENEDHKKSSFITLTYDENFLPDHGSLDFKAIADFWKRVRKKYYGNQTGELKYYLCGEYGPTTYRPHYHAAVFGLDFEPEEWIMFKQDSSGPHYTSPTLLKLWPFGFNEVSILNPYRMNYVAGYIQKKLLGASSVEYMRRQIAAPNQRFSKMLGVNALMRDKDRLIDLFMQRKGKHIPKYYASKLAINELTTEDGFQLAALYHFDLERERREKYPKLSDTEYIELMASKRHQQEVDMEARLSLFHNRSSI